MIGIVILIFIFFVVVVSVTARVLITLGTESEPSSAQPLTHILYVPFGNPITDEGGLGAGEGEGEMNTNQVEINRLKAELAAKVREAEELQCARKVDKAQIDRLTTVNESEPSSAQPLTHILTYVPFGNPITDEGGL